MTMRAFTQIDVFTSTAYLGNPVAVVLDGQGLSDEDMQRFARWTQLSETTFVTPPSETARAAGADYRVRIFTAGGELPFAGHPTLGTAHAWREAGGQAQDAAGIVQECGVGLVRLKPMANAWAFAAPPLERTDPSKEELKAVAAALGLVQSEILGAQHLNNGPQWLGLWLDQPDTVLRLQPDHSALKHLGIKVGVAARYTREDQAPLIGRSNREARAFAGSSGPRPKSESIDLEVRAFAAPIDIHEDPVTGSLNASLAQWLITEGCMPQCYVASQGAALGRAGRVLISQDASGQVWVGGHTVTCITGAVVL